MRRPRSPSWSGLAGRALGSPPSPFRPVHRRRPSPLLFAGAEGEPGVGPGGAGLAQGGQGREAQVGLDTQAGGLAQRDAAADGQERGLPGQPDGGGLRAEEEQVAAQDRSVGEGARERAHHPLLGGPRVPAQRHALGRGPGERRAALRVRSGAGGLGATHRVPHARRSTAPSRGSSPRCPRSSRRASVPSTSSTSSRRGRTKSSAGPSGRAPRPPRRPAPSTRTWRTASSAPR